MGGGGRERAWVVVELDGLAFSGGQVIDVDTNIISVYVECLFSRSHVDTNIVDPSLSLLGEMGKCAFCVL